MPKNAMPIEYRDSIEGLTPQQLEGFFADWPQAPSPECHLQMLRNSFRRVIAVDSQTGIIAGFIYAISDGVLSAYIPLLEVRRKYQGHGIGSELLQRLVSELRDFYMVDLVCDPGLVPYYERLGMHRLAGMAHRNRDSLQGPC